MVELKISDKSKPLEEVNKEWITRTINKNRIISKENNVEVNINSENAKLVLFANSEQADQAKASNKIEERIVFLWHEIVLSNSDLDPDALYDFLNRVEEWVAFVPKK